METKKYKYWDVLDEMPEGWKIDKTAGSPLHGHEFITNGKSPLYGQKRALLKINVIRETEQKLIEITVTTNKETEGKQITKNWAFDCGSVKVVNELARKKCQERILNDIMVDLMICEIEGWGKTEYICELKKLIGGLLSDKNGGYCI